MEPSKTYALERVNILQRLVDTEHDIVHIFPTRVHDALHTHLMVAKVEGLSKHQVPEDLVLHIRVIHQVELDGHDVRVTVLLAVKLVDICVHAVHCALNTLLEFVHFGLGVLLVDLRALLLFCLQILVHLED